MSEFLTSIYVDSRARSADSYTPTDSRLQLDGGLAAPGGVFACREESAFYATCIERLVLSR